MRREVKICDNCGKEVDKLYRFPVEFELFNFQLIDNVRKGDRDYCYICAKNLLTKLNNVLKFEDGE